MNQMTLTLILIAVVIVVGGYLLNSCTNTAADSIERIASVNSPQSQAEGYTQRLMGEIQATAEAIHVEVTTRGQAELEIERARELQRLTLAQQGQRQEAEHAARLADIRAKEAETMARASVAWVGPVAEKVVIVLGVLGLVVVGVIGALAVRRVGAAWATKVEHRANVPMTFNYDPNTLTAPVFLALVNGVPTMVNPNTGEVIPLNKARNAEAARLRYLAAQNIVALQANGEHAPMLPSLDRVGP